MPPVSRLPVIPLFDQKPSHSFVPTSVRTAVARSSRQGRPFGRRDSASPLMAASTMAILQLLRATVCIVTIFASSMLFGVVAHAERALSAKHQANGPSIDPFAGFITEASRRFKVSERWIRSVMQVESAGNVRARSRKGAMGLMQIMPQTWSDLRARYDLGADPYDPRDNILAGAAYIRELYNRYGTPGFLAAYNAGPGRYENHLATGRSLPDETQDYVTTLAPMTGGKQADGKFDAAADSLTLARSPLFVVRSAGNSSNDRSSPRVQLDRRSSGRAVVDQSALVPQSSNLFVHLASETRRK